MGATLQCSFGVAPSALMVLPQNRVLTGPVPSAANIMDNKPLVNILPFGMCSSLANPTVAIATAAALGVLTPMPCIPVTPGAMGSRVTNRADREYARPHNQASITASATFGHSV